MRKAKYTRGKDGYFQTKVWNGEYTDSGKKKYVPIRSKKSSADLERIVAEHKRNVSERKIIKKTAITFVEYARQWKSLYKSSKEVNTQTMYESIIEKHLIAIDGVMMDTIGRTHYQIVINNANGKPRTQQQIHMTFKQICKSAVSDQYMTPKQFDDIFSLVSQVKYRPPERRPLEEHEKQAIFNAVLSSQDKAFLYVLYGCGLRRGEALGLKRSDIALRTKILAVNRAVAYKGNNSYIKGTKSHNGLRTVPIPDKIYPYLKLYLSGLSREFLFTMRNGGLISKSAYDKMWARIIRKMQETTETPISGLTAHVFRHNYCTNLCYQIPTVSIKQIARLLGDTEKMVIDVYNHVLLEKEDTAKAVGNALNF